MNDIAGAIEERMDRVEEKLMLELEKTGLKKYIEKLMNTTNQEGTTLAPPMPIPWESLVSYEAMKSALQEVKKWVEDIRRQAKDFLTKMVQAHERTRFKI